MNTNRYMPAALLPTALALLGPLAQGCASRTVPTALPDASPASTRAAAAPAANVTTALDEHPPLPGAASDRWPGLEAAPAAATDHSHHGGSHAAPAAAPTGGER